ncbi:GDSL-type esterase/lipase family protein [Fodinicola feengrottensis]|uniref:GDSL-type esterase/lipase family protein n=1 Tax=Fodinicola feengrottensis TaxID=435914 RepID=UPI0013D462FE|nr:GDSL-type esterase/lipase family protein [Fodinicola feengrottensis]
MDFVGSQTSGPTNLPDQNHEGHPGWTIAQLSQQVVGWLTTYKPDMVLLHIGTNDMYTDATSAAAPAELSTLLDQITQTVPAAKVYVASIIPLADAAGANRVLAYDATIPGIVGAKAAAGKNVSFVDMHSAVPTAELVDGIHPTVGGYSRMAARWYSAIVGTPFYRYESEQAANATSTDTQQVAGNRSSGGVRVGHIDFPDSALTFTVYAPKTGTSRIYVRADDGMNMPCSHQLSVNGATPFPVTYPSFGWDYWSITGVNVNVTAGANTFKFTKGDCYAEMDEIDFTTPAA